MTELMERADDTASLAASRALAEMPQTPLLVWAQEARQAAQIAESLSKTSFVPATLRGKPADITAAILAGQELGLQPMASLRSMDIIQGTPALRAHAMRGLVQSKGHSVQLVESTETRCVMRGRRKGEDEWQEVDWTIQRATALGLTSKSEWKKQPKTMLVARATGEVCRLIASDVLYAMPYATEELDGFEASAEQPQRRATGPVTAAELLGRAAPAEVSSADESAPATPNQEDIAEHVAAIQDEAGEGE